MPVHVWLAAGMVVAAVPLLLWSLRGGRSTRLVRANLGDYRPSASAGIGFPSAAGRGDTISNGLADLARRITPHGQLNHLENRLISAGLDQRWTVERVLVTKVVLGAFPIIFGVIQMASTGRVGWLLLGIAAGAALFWLPDMQIGGKARAREEEIELQLPDIIDQITVTVEAGLGFDSAMRRVTSTAEGPLVEEFERVLQDVHMGFPRDEALEALSERTQVKDLRLFASAVNQAGRYGISIGDVLRSQSAELREKRKFRAEERAMKIPVKIVMPLVACILPVLFIVLLGPAFLRISVANFGG